MNTTLEEVTNYVNTSLNECNTFTYVTRLGQSGNGFGNAAESCIYGIEENNRQAPDIERFGTEIKCANSDTKSLMTCFCNDPKINLMLSDEEEGKRKKGAMRSLVETYSFSDETDADQRNNFFFDLKIGKVTKIGESDFSLVRDDSNLWITADGHPVAGWPTEVVVKSACSKFGATGGNGGSLTVKKGKSTLIENIDDKSATFEHETQQAMVYHGFDQDSFVNALDDGAITVSLRAWAKEKQTKTGKTILYIRNRGTAFRVSHNNVSKLFRESAVGFKK